MKWPTVQLETIATDIQPGFAKQPDQNGKGIPHLRTNNVSEDGHLDLSTIKAVVATNNQVEKYSLSPGDIVFNNTNSPALVGNTAFFDKQDQYLFSNHMTRIRICDEVADPRFIARYLYWIWKTGGFRVLVTQWVNPAAINQSQLAKVRLCLPPLSEQRRIVEILDQADALRKKRAEADAKAERILPALFYKMFGDPATNSMGWSISELGDVCEKITSGSRGWAKYTGRGNSFFIRTQDINNGEISSDLLHVAPPVGPESERTRLDDGDVVITITGMVGKAAVFKLHNNNTYVSQHVALVRPKPTLSPDFVAAFANFSVGDVSLLARSQYGQTKPGLGFRELRTAKIPLPPIDLQKRFSDQVRKIQALRKYQLEAQSQLKNLWHTLLHTAFSGDLTAKWREAHMQELLAEMKTQAKALKTDDASGLAQQLSLYS